MSNNLQMDDDEGIILESDEAFWVSRELELTRLILTNKNIYCTYEKSNGMLKKSTEELEILSLSDIKIINGQVLMQTIKYAGMLCLQIQFKPSVEYFSFARSPKKVIPQWIDAIYRSLGIISATSEPPVKEAKTPNAFLGAFAEAFSDVTDVFKTTAGNVEEPLEIESKQSEDSINDTIGNHSIDSAPIEHPTQQPVEMRTEQGSFCVNCGTSLVAGTKFCPSCGYKVGSEGNGLERVQESDVGQSRATSPPMPDASAQDITHLSQSATQRQQVYVGIVLKCPNCGGVISETTAVCPECGMRITGRDAVTSVQSFKEQIMAIEGTRKKGSGGFFGAYTAPDPADIKKLSLVRNFPIPNSVDDIMEFMFLAVANIDVDLSKKTVVNRLNKVQQIETGATIGRTISDAWVAKMQQAYQKAEIMFPNDSAFHGIQKIYYDKMIELKIKV